MKGGPLPASVKRTSVLRRVPPFGNLRFAQAPGFEGCVCAFKLAPETSPIIVEAVTGRSMTVVPGDVFLATPGYRESTRFAVGGIPKRGLIPGNNYWVLSESDRQTLNIRDFALPAADRLSDYGAPVFLFLGTSAEIGKTTAGLTVLRALLQKGHATVIALKATGTSGITEIASYQDYGAAQVFDCVDFGLPTTYPSKRKGMADLFERVLDTCLSIPAESVLIECGGDMMGANVPIFLKHLKRRRSRAKVILAAADALGALSGTRMLREMGLSVSLITGPCTDSPTLRQRTEALCRTPAMNMARGASIGALV